MSDVIRSLGYLTWPSPVLDERASIDPFTAARLDGDRIVLTLASGDEVEARCTVPVPGVLRVRVGDDLGPPAATPMLVDLDDEPASLTAVDGGIAIRGPDVEAFWPSDGDAFTCGAYRRAPLVGIITGSIGGAGRVVTAEGAVGWIETARLEPDAAVYGSGEAFQGPNLRGRVRRMVNSETHGAGSLDLSYLNVPLLWSDAGWGLLFHTGAPVRADLGAAHGEVAAVAVEGAELDVFVLTGYAPAILRRYHDLTGLPGRFPDWAFGVWTSRCSYLSAAEISDVLDRYERARCPVDVVHVDAWVEGNVVAELTCNWSVDRDRFPEGWVREINERGVRVSLWHNPYVFEGSDLALELDGAGLLVRSADGDLARTNDKPDRFLVDFTNPDAVEWWKQAVRRVATTEGNEAFKPDFAEEVPEDAVFHDGRRGRELRNEYALRYQRATHEAMRDVLGSDAVALFCRSGTAGAQRHPCHWVGDSPSSWDGLVTALRACLSLSLSGFAIVGSDVGGFWTADSFARMRDAFESWDPSSITADVDPQLYARWAQWGAFSPVMRFHGTGSREPWAYPEPYRSVAIEACRIRTRLRGYLASTAERAARDGTPMMRPMPYAYPADRGARDADLQYLLGPDVLVAPIVTPGPRRRLYVPDGRWRPLWRTDAVEGPGWTEIECAPDAFPVFLRPGAEEPFGA